MKFAVPVLLLSLLALSEALFGMSRNSWTRFGSEPFEVRSGEKFADLWITQKLDNFDPSNNATWQMRYLENNRYFKPGGDMFIFLGGEWTINSGSIGEGQHITDLAKENDGILFYTEHRYYGLSRPTPNTASSNLKYLNVDQALADVAHFIREIRTLRAELRDAKVIVVGGSYSATMAAWMRQKYPDLVAGAWASSAPLNAQVNFFEYKEVMGQSIENLGGPSCLSVFRTAYYMMEKMVEAKDVERINQELNLCKPLNVSNQLDVWNLFSELSDDVAGLVQSHRNQDIQNACRTLTESRELDAFAAYAAWTRGRTRGCFEHVYSDFVKDMRETAWSAPANQAMRQWLYQTCAEFGWYQTSDSNAQPFGSSFPVELYYLMCKDFYGDEFDKERVDNGVRRTNLANGGFNPTATNVYYTHGHVDPWKAMGVQKDVSESAPATVIPLISHCADLGSIRTGEATEITLSKQRVARLVRLWLNE